MRDAWPGCSPRDAGRPARTRSSAAGDAVGDGHQRQLLSRAAAGDRGSLSYLLGSASAQRWTSHCAEGECRPTVVKPPFQRLQRPPPAVLPARTPTPRKGRARDRTVRATYRRRDRRDARFLGVSDLDDLFAEIPDALRLNAGLDLPPSMSEPDVAWRLDDLAARTGRVAETWSASRGAGSYDHEIPAVVRSLASRWSSSPPIRRISPKWPKGCCRRSSSTRR